MSYQLAGHGDMREPLGAAMEKTTEYVITDRTNRKSVVLAHRAGMAILDYSGNDISDLTCVTCGVWVGDVVYEKDELGDIFAPSLWVRSVSVRHGYYDNPDVQHEKCEVWKESANRPPLTMTSAHEQRLRDEGYVETVMNITPKTEPEDALVERLAAELNLRANPAYRDALASVRLDGETRPITREELDAAEIVNVRDANLRGTEGLTVIELAENSPGLCLQCGMGWLAGEHGEDGHEWQPKPPSADAAKSPEGHGPRAAYRDALLSGMSTSEAAKVGREAEDAAKRVHETVQCEAEAIDNIKASVGEDSGYYREMTDAQWRASMLERDPLVYTGEMRVTPVDATLFWRKPNRAHSDDAGYDLYVAAGVIIPPGETKNVAHNIRIQMPRGVWASIYPRSSAVLKGMAASNTVIDNGYRGPLFSIVTNRSDRPLALAQGDRISQLVLHRMETPNVVVVSDLEDSERGERGFGSTGA